jgi:adenylate cyclase
MRVELDAEPEGCSVDAVRAELHRVLLSPQFDASQRNRRFLEYVIDEALAGRASRIKAYNIATEVFGRNVNFDPQLDPVVRMEARRLRRSLERFYLIDGGGAVRIAMPKGGYVPEFSSNAVALPKPAATASKPYPAVLAGDHSSSIAVIPFDGEGDGSSFCNFNQGFTDQILVALSRFPEISVFGQPAAAPRQRPAASGAPLEQPHAFTLSGSTALFGGRINVKAVLADARTGRVVWGQTLERDLQPDNILIVRDELANRVVRGLTQPSGPILGAISKRADAKRLAVMTPLEAIARFSKCRTSWSRTLHHDVQRTLERSVDSVPGYAETWACLSHVYSDGYRFGFAADDTSPKLLEKAVHLARRAIELEPNSSRACHALGIALWLVGDVPASLVALQRALELNTNATEARADLGLSWILSGHPKRGLPLLEEALTQMPMLPTPRVGLSLYHFANEHYQAAFDQAAEVHAPDTAQGFVVRAACLVRLGRNVEAAREVERIIGLTPYGGRRVLSGLIGGSAETDLAGKLVVALRDAGLPCEMLH